MVQLDHKNPDDHRFLRAFARKHGRTTRGRATASATTSTSSASLARADADRRGLAHDDPGALGMLSIGAGGLDVAVVMAGHAFEVKMPKWSGVSRRWLCAPGCRRRTDPRAAAPLSVRGGKGRVFEFTGPGVATPAVPGARNDREHDRRARRDLGALRARRTARAMADAGNAARTTSRELTADAAASTTTASNRARRAGPAGGATAEIPPTTSCRVRRGRGHRDRRRSASAPR